MKKLRNLNFENDNNCLLTEMEEIMILGGVGVDARGQNANDECSDNVSCSNNDICRTNNYCTGNSKDCQQNGNCINNGECYGSYTGTSNPAHGCSCGR